MRQGGRRPPFETFLWGEVVLVALLSGALVFFVSRSTLRTPYDLPQLRLVLATLFMVGGALVALLCGTRFGVEGRRFELLLCGGFFTISLSWLLFTLAPAVAGRPATTTGWWTTITGGLVGWALIAYAPFARGRSDRCRVALIELLTGLVVAVALVAITARFLPLLQAGNRDTLPPELIAPLAAIALANLVALIGFGNRFRVQGEDLDRWLALGATLSLFGSLDSLFGPLDGASAVTQGDFLRLLAYGVLVVGVWRAIRASEFGRAVADERARVAREIHDGLSQYLFAVATHTSLLESGADPAETLPRLKAAALAAQREARFAVLALSSAAGSASFDNALRRYVDILAADGELDVELEVDPGIRLAPDEQIEVFRIVQEGLANARQHSAARRAWVAITRRGPERLVTVRDDGVGFTPPTGGGGQGLRNMRQRAAAIGGAFSLTSTPGTGTALEVVLRP